MDYSAVMAGPARSIVKYQRVALVLGLRSVGRPVMGGRKVSLVSALLYPVIAGAVVLRDRASRLSGSTPDLFGVGMLRHISPSPSLPS